MESGIVKLFPAFNGSKETTAEEMKAYVKTGVDLFCSLSGLVILESKTINHTHGVVYLLGTEGSEQAIIAMGNHSNDSYFYDYLFFSLIGPDDKIEFTDYMSGSNENSNGKTLRMYNNYNCYMKYIKGSKNFIFDLGVGQSAPTFIKCNIITKYSVDGIEKDAMIYMYSTDVCMSYDITIGNESSRKLFDLQTNKVPYIKSDQEGILNVYAGGDGEFPYIKLFTNKRQFSGWTMFSAGNKKYIILNPASGYITLIAEIE